MFYGRRYVAWSAEKIRTELEPLIKSGVEKILLYDSFLGSKKRVQRIGEMFLEFGLDWAIEDGCRVDYHSTDEFYRSLADTGCKHIAYGAESGSQRMLDLLNKDICVEDIIRSAEVRRPYNIKARYQWLTGLPGETREDYKKTFSLMDKITRINSQSTHNIELYLPYPGNELFNKACSSGWQPPQDLEGWGLFRWEGKYPYHKEGTWFYKTIQYSNFFFRQFSLSAVSAYSSNLRPVYRVFRFLLWPFALIRWKLRFFRFPVEFKIAEFFRKRIERISQ